jgi:hypothetical protein
MKYTFICEDTYLPWKNISEFEVDTIEDVVQNFNLFLKGNGFDFQVGVLDSEYYPTDTESSDAVISSILDALSNWPKDTDASQLKSSVEICDLCKLPKSIMINHCQDENCSLEK